MIPKDTSVDDDNWIALELLFTRNHLSFLYVLSLVQLCNAGAAAHQAPLSTEFTRQE